jgi:hypothetical protein
MANQRIKALSTGIGVGLLAATLSGVATAGVPNNPAQAAIYYRAGTTPVYVVTAPSGNQATDSLVMVELSQADPTKNTWTLQPSLSGAFSTATGTMSAGIKLTQTVATGTVYTNDSNFATATFDLGSTGTASNGVDALAGFWGGAASKTWIAPYSAAAQFNLNGTSVVGSGTGAANCGFTFIAKMDTDGNLKVITNTNSMTLNLTDGTTLNAYSSINSAVWFPTVTKTSGLAAGDWTSYAVTAIGAYDPLASGSVSFATSLMKTVYKTSQASMGTSASAATTLNVPIATQVNKVNSCRPIYDNRVALNNTGVIVGGSNGMIRIW